VIEPEHGEVNDDEAAKNDKHFGNRDGLFSNPLIASSSRCCFASCRHAKGDVSKATFRPHPSEFQGDAGTGSVGFLIGNTKIDRRNYLGARKAIWRKL
jgi:hypothetical protein